MGKRWDYDVPSSEVWQEVLRVLKPGGHLLAFAGTRTQHRMAVRIEDAGFEIRDMIAWVYGSGFPKSLDVSKAIDSQDAVQEQQARRYRFTAWVRSTGVTSKQIDDATETNMGGHYTTAASQPAIMTREHLEACRHLLGDVPEWVERECDIRSIESQTLKSREVVGEQTKARSTSGKSALPTIGGSTLYESWNITAPATEAAKQWAGWGTALKPSWESVTWARKPLPLETERRTIRTNLFQMEARLWLLLNVSVVKSSSASNQSEFAEALNTARWTADECISTQAGLCDQMGMSLFELAANISLNTVSSWNRILGDVWNQTSTSTIETASSMTTDWKTLRYCLSQITVENMLQANSLPGGFNANACNAGRTFSALLASLEATLTLSAIGPAMSQAAESYPEKDVRPHLEPVMVARKPLSGTVAENVLEHGTGAINVDGCRVGTDDVWAPSTRGASESIGTFKTKQRTTEQHDAGRFPANLIHDGSDEVVGLFPEDGEASASRFFYCAKADAAERRNSKHPTVKPVALMRYLVRLVCPAGGVVLDPFAGSGTTIEAARLEHCRAIGIEREAEYCADILERLRQGVLF
jgi:hypothetical protein